MIAAPAWIADAKQIVDIIMFDRDLTAERPIDPLQPDATTRIMDIIAQEISTAIKETNVRPLALQIAKLIQIAQRAFRSHKRHSTF